MKICFLLQRRFTPIGIALAHEILQKHPGTTFCSYVDTKSRCAFLKEQVVTPFTAFLIEEDIHKKICNEKIDTEYLKWLEKEYGIPNLWPYLYIDRVIMNGQLLREYPYDTPLLSYEDMLRKLQVTAKALIDFLETEKPDAVVTSVIGSVGSMLLHHVAKKKGIKTIHIEFARIGNRIVFTEDYRTLSWVRSRFTELQNGSLSPYKDKAQNFITEFRSAPAPYDAETADGFYDTSRLKNLHFLLPKNLLRSIIWHVRTFFKDISQATTSDYTHVFIWWATWDKMKRKIRALRGYQKFYFDHRTYTGRYAYYPLHIEPEIAMLLYAPFYTNQIELIRATARSLPIDMLLFVKEHPGMMGYRTRDYYKELAKIPNVRLISPGVPGNQLALGAALTVTITSTSGWESLLLKKPVVTFGDVFYNDIPGVLTCRNFEELPHMVQKQLEEWQHDEQALENYVSALLEDSVDVYFADMWNRAADLDEILKDQGMKDLAHLLAQKTGLK